MAVLLDDPVWTWNGRRWAHLVSDESYAELHAFATALGIPRRAFQGDHYDLPSERRGDAIALGAEPVGSRELLRRLKAAGLRLSPGERRQFPRQVAPGRAVESPVGGVAEVDARPPGELREDD